MERYTTEIESLVLTDEEFLTAIGIDTGNSISTLVREDKLIKQPDGSFKTEKRISVVFLRRAV